MNATKILSTLSAITVCTLLVMNTSNQAMANDHANKNLSQLATSQSAQSKSDAQMLIAASAANRISVIKQLVNDGVDIDTPAIGDGTALMIAIKKGNSDMVDSLLLLGANVNASSPGDGNPLILASKLGDLSLVKKLINQGAIVDQQVKGDETPLINASSQGELAVVKYLVNQGADVNLAVEATTRSGTEMRSPLSQASSRQVREYLINQGAIEL
jgi:ankyrin repeat protein